MNWGWSLFSRRALLVSRDGIFEVKSLPVFFPVLVEEFESGDADVFRFFGDGGGGGIVIFKVSFASAVPGRSEAPFIISEDVGEESCEDGVVSFDLITSVNVIVIVVHGAVCVVPTLDTFGEILGAIFGGIASFLSAEDDEDFIFSGHVDIGSGGLSVDEDISSIEAFLEECRWLVGEGFNQFVK